jgi:predicted DNA-binding transcriptional regulator AlpA
MNDRLLSIEEVMERFGVTRNALAQMRYEGRGPKFVKLSVRNIKYRESDVEAWIADRVYSTTAEAA